MRIVILSVALRDLAAGRRFYERQQAGLGDYFLHSLYEDIETLTEFGGIHRKFRGYHRLLAKRFPFAIYYKLDGQTVEIWRILDCRRDPRKTDQALESTNGPAHA